MERLRDGLVVFIALGAVALARPARAQDETAAAGDTVSAMPGIHRVGLAPSGPVRLSVAGTAGYGYTEELEDEGGAHHRLIGVLGLAARPVSWLEVGLRLDGRYDTHPDDALGSDDGWTGEPRLALRLGGELAQGLRLGGELDLLVPGGDAPSLAFDAVALQGTLLGSYTPAGSGLTLAADVGYRFDRTADSVDQPDRLRQGDRIALGVSDSDAVVLGLGAAQRLGPVELLAELTWDLHVGDDAPAATESPIRVAVGGRYHVSRLLQLELMTETSASRRPDVGPGRPLTPIAPRFTAMLGARLAVGFEDGAGPAAAAGPGSAEQGVEPEAGARGDAGPPPGRTEDAAPALEGRVVDADGAPLGGAQVRLEVGDEIVAEAQTDEEGRFALEGHPDEPAALVVAAEGFEERRLELAPGTSPPAAVALQPEVPMGELRGLVRSFSGRPLRATIRVTPGDTEVRTSAEGRFELPLEEGSYEVVIDARGYRQQDRTVEVERGGVTVLNVELRRRRGR